MKSYLITIILSLCLLLTVRVGADEIDDYHLQVDVTQTQDITNIHKTSSVSGGLRNEIISTDFIKQIYDRFIETSRRFMASFKQRQAQQTQNLKNLKGINDRNAEVLARTQKLRQSSSLAAQKSFSQSAKDKNRDLVRRFRSSTSR